MRLLREWDTDLIMLTKIKDNLLYARIYYTEIFSLSILILIFIAVLVDFKWPELIISLIVLAAASATSLIFIGKKVKSDNKRLIDTINDIRDSKLNSAEEIKLRNNWVELEKSIRSMYERSNNDIANLKKLEHVRTEFLGNVSHELRTPIFAIQGFLETLYNGALDDPKVNKSFLGKAILHTNNLNNLLNDLIDISMIESGNMRMSFSYFNISEFLEAIVAQNTPFAEEKNLILEISSISQNLELYGDKERLRQVMGNLVQNALKYTEKGKVQILVKEEESSATIIVKDTGLGLSKGDLGRVFERFYRVDRDRSRQAGGTGLGLAIVKHIIEAHQSKIEVKSKPGFGSEFSFKLKK